MKLLILFLLLSTTCFSQTDTNVIGNDTISYSMLKQIVLDNKLKLDDNIKRHEYAGKYYKSAGYSYIAGFILSVGGSALIIFSNNEEGMRTTGTVVCVLGLSLNVNGLLLTAQGNKIMYYR